MATGTIAEDKVIRVKRNPWADNFFRPLLITIMIMCLSISIVNLVRLVNPAWSGAFFLLGMLITTVEAIYSYRVLQRYRTRGVSVWRYRLAEAVVLIVLLKFLSLVGKPLAVVQAELLAAWKSYVAALSEALSQEALTDLKNDLLGRAKLVAEAAGGMLGLGNKISKSEQAMLDELAQAFE